MQLGSSGIHHRHNIQSLNPIPSVQSSLRLTNTHKQNTHTHTQTTHKHTQTHTHKQRTNTHTHTHTGFCPTAVKVPSIHEWPRPERHNRRHSCPSAPQPGINQPPNRGRWLVPWG